MTLDAFDNGDVKAKYRLPYNIIHHHPDEDDIEVGIFKFLAEFHSFNPEVMTVHGIYSTPEDGFWAEVSVNE